MRRLLLALALALGCSSCAQLDEIKIPVNDYALIAADIQGILLRSDLNGDGVATGWAELVELLQQLYMALDGNPETDG